MYNDPACFAKLIEKEKPDYVIHTASPFFEETSMNGETTEKVK
jgi:dTDP-4-dehydrorhamnose reductase